MLSAYAYAVAESSACGDPVVTSPTCGSSGVLPAVLYYAHRHMKVRLEKIRDSLYVAGMIGNLVKQNATIAGSIGGCQAEIGTASSMAAAALCDIFGLNLYQVEYAAEVAMEHFLGLSCDPVDGYVIIPCIERNGIAAARALTCFYYARYISPIRQNKVNFDDVVAAMKITGESLSSDYKETALGGLAYVLDPRHC
ncbi:MAG: L-serine ammonia-lyase, iron-sulfur-dependent, subunit alpha [Bacilli bacterium]|nr:L-serine ammonia-lyase, iron-sulfur-dependent, subunit alpha [Bacilli bacterium]